MVPPKSTFFFLVSALVSSGSATHAAAGQKMIFGAQTAVNGSCASSRLVYLSVYCKCVQTSVCTNAATSRSPSAAAKTRLKLWRGASASALPRPPRPRSAASPTNTCPPRQARGTAPFA
ncbi:hypothetical protein C8J57DRAFT_1387626 [Mycena rebaudengoi]|nr:hypothetical protein C8J57DRAFT_1387626 [Mycena rebaudengoi]